MTQPPIPTTSRQRPESSPPRRPGPGLPSHHFDARTGPKPAVAARIVERSRLLDRPLYLGDDPAAVARTFRAESLRLLVAELGGFVGVRK